MLARSLLSKSPLSDVFLHNQGATIACTHPKPETTLSSSIAALQITQQNAPTLNLKLTLNKSTNKILFAEATNEFFDFLCSFLTISIGSMIRVLKGNSGLGSIDNLYTSVMKLDEKWFGSCGKKSYILDPRVAPHHNCQKQPLSLAEQQGERYLINPRRGDNFSLSPSEFIVLDNLEVKPLSSASSFLILRELKVPFSDIEEQAITIGMKEVIKHCSYLHYNMCVYL